MTGSPFGEVAIPYYKGLLVVSLRYFVFKGNPWKDVADIGIILFDEKNVGFGKVAEITDYSVS